MKVSMEVKTIDPKNLKDICHLPRTIEDDEIVRVTTLTRSLNYTQGDLLVLSTTLWTKIVFVKMDIASDLISILEIKPII